VVIAKPISYEGGHPVHGRLRNVATDGFEWNRKEWLYLDDWHFTETLHYLAMESGMRKLADGRPGYIRTRAGGTEYVQTEFSQSFDAAPVVFSTSQTFNEGEPIVTRNRNVSTSGFSVRLQEEASKGW